MKTKAFIILVVLQSITIAYLGTKLYQRRKILGTQVVVNPIKKENLIISPNSGLEYFYEPKPNFVEKIDEPFKATYTHNSDSFNERFEYSIEKPEDTFRIITLGDSFTFGKFVDTKDNWPELLEDMLNTKIFCKNINNFEVINLGMSGYDIKYSVERFRKRGQKYNPDLVLLFRLDLRRITDKLLPFERLFHRQLEESGMLEKLIEEGKPNVSWNKAIDKVFNQLGEEGVLEYQGKALKEINNYYKGKLVLSNFSYGLSASEEELIKNFVASRNKTEFYNGITLYEIKDTTFPADGHPNKKGHRLIAEDHFDYLVKNKIIPCD